MPSVPDLTSIPAPRVPFVDPTTGLIANEWYRFLLNLFTITGSGGNSITLDDLQLGPPVQESVSSGGGGGGTGDVVGPASSTDNAIVRFDGTTGKLIQGSSVILDDNGNESGVNAITFDITPATLPTAEGTLYWDSADGNKTLSLVMNGGNAVQQIGEEQYYRIKASSAITEGQVVMFTGTVGASGALTGAPAFGLTASTASYVMGIATENIAHNGWGYVTSFGLVRSIDTSAFTAGDILYLDPTVAGGLTASIPAAPNPKVQVCACIYSSASVGSYFVRPSFGGILGQYEGDVNISAPANGDLLIRNQTAGKWVNAPLTAGTGISVTNSAGGITIANTSPSSGGTVTSVGMTVPTGLTVTGSPVTTSGTLAVSYTSGYSIPTTASQTNWDTAYSERLQWDGGSTNLVASTGRTSLGGTTVGQNFFTLTNPSTITFPRINADNSVSALSASAFRTAIGAGTGDGTVTSVSGTAPIASSGGTTPAISISQAGASTDGYLSSTDWNTFNSKQPAGTYVTSVTGTSPITSSGGTTPALSLASGYGDTQNPYASKTANYFLAAPNGSSGAPTFRAMVAADVPTLNQNTTGTAGNVTGVVAIANGGTGQTTKTEGFDALAPTTTKGDLIVSNGSDNVRLGVGADTYILTADSTAATGVKWAPGSGGGGGVSSFSTGTTGLTPSAATTGAITLAGTLAIANGGTNQTSFTSPVSSVAGLVWFDGTRFQNDSTTSHVGYNASTNTFYANNMVVSGDASFTSTSSILLPSGTTAQRPSSTTAGQIRYNSTTGSVEAYQNGAWYPFTTGVYAISYLSVAGGGGGGYGASGSYQGGGGGGGGLITGSTVVYSGGTIAIVVGGGGAGGGGTGLTGVQGTNTTLGSLATCIGGGYGGAGGANGGSGGSGGGGSYLGNSGGSGTSGQGYRGGNYYTGGQSAQGGGASAQGPDTTSYVDNGLTSSISGSSVQYAKGGVTGVAAPANTGWGGGGYGSGGTPGAGGAGVVIISYPGGQRGSGGTVTSSGGYTIHTFTTSGTFTA